MQMNKNIKIFINYFLGPLLFAWLSYAIYRQILGQPQLEESWFRIRQSFQSYKIIYLILAILLILVNWGLESWKWMISVRTFYQLKFLQAFKAVLSGVSFSVTMPNRVGEYFGRIMYLPEGNRLKTISVTLVGSFAQLLITIIVGTAGLIILKPSLVGQFPQLKIWYQFIVYGLVILGGVMLLIYFNVAGSVNLFNRWIRNQKYVYLVEALRKFHTVLLLQILLLSFLRYLVFVIQYILVFHLFEVNIPAATIATVMSVVFLAMAVIPSIALVEVWLRGEISIKLMGLFSLNTLGIGFTSVTVWFINLILPAIAGSLLLLSLRVFKNDDN
jgi:Lysylphosphatidylglycerol synthase TM region